MAKPAYMIRDEMQSKIDALEKQLAELEEFENAALEFMACIDLNRSEEAAAAYERMREALKERGHRDVA